MMGLLNRIQQQKETRLQHQMQRFFVRQCLLGVGVGEVGTQFLLADYMLTKLGRGGSRGGRGRRKSSGTPLKEDSIVNTHETGYIFYLGGAWANCCISRMTPMKKNSRWRASKQNLAARFINQHNSTPQQRHLPVAVVPTDASTIPESAKSASEATALSPI